MNEVIQAVLLIIFSIEIIFAFVLFGYLCGCAEDNNGSFLFAVKDLIDECFSNKNIFGYIFNIILAILLLPMLIIEFFLIIMVYIGKIFIWIWKLGEK